MHRTGRRTELRDNSFASLELCRLEQIVRVEKRDPCPARDANAMIARGCHTFWRMLRAGYNLPWNLRVLHFHARTIERVVVAAVIHHDELGVAISLRGHRGERGFDVRAGIERWDDNRKEW